MSRRRTIDSGMALESAGRGVVFRWREHGAELESAVAALLEYRLDVIGGGGVAATAARLARVAREASGDAEHLSRLRRGMDFHDEAGADAFLLGPILARVHAAFADAVDGVGVAEAAGRLLELVDELAVVSTCRRKATLAA